MQLSRVTLLGVAILVLIIPMGFVVAGPDARPSSLAVPASYRAQEMLPDPAMVGAPDVEVAGTVEEEFSWTYEPSHVRLNWTHTAGTLIRFRPAYEYSKPECYDYVFFSQTFEWTLNTLPEQAAFKLNLSVACSGDFDSSAGNHTYAVAVWSVDSSDEWTELCTLTPELTLGNYVEHSFDLGTLEITHMFGGTIEDELGEQENPNDTVTLVAMLTPLRAFLAFNFTEPWNEWNGSVAASFSGLSLEVLVEQETTSAERLEPLFNVTYGSNVSDVFADVPMEWMSARDEFAEIATDDQGMLYFLVNSNSDYGFWTETGHFFRWESILKYDPRLSLVWRVNNDNMTEGHDMRVKDGHIYTTGSLRTAGGGLDVYVTKWTLDGTRVWNFVWDSGVQEEGTGVALAENGSIYVIVAMTEPDDYLSAGVVLLNLDIDGVLVWNRTLVDFYFPLLDIDIDAIGDYVLFHYFTAIGWLNSSCLAERWHRADVHSVDDAGNVYACYGDDDYGSMQGTAAVLSKMDSSGNRLWSSNFTLKYSDRWGEELAPVSLTVFKNGSVIAAIGGDSYSGECYLVAFGADGQYLWHKSIIESVPSVWRQVSYNEALSLCVTETGLVYLGMSAYRLGGSIDCRFLAYVVGPYQLPPLPIGPEVVLTLVAAAALGTVITADWFLRKRRKKAS